MTNALVTNFQSTNQNHGWMPTVSFVHECHHFMMTFEECHHSELGGIPRRAIAGASNAQISRSTHAESVNEALKDMSFDPRKL
jgi:hypothetical protein